MKNIVFALSLIILFSCEGGSDEPKPDCNKLREQRDRAKEFYLISIRTTGYSPEEKAEIKRKYEEAEKALAKDC